MPDLVTHTASAWLLGKIIKSPHSRVLLYLGALLPDLITRPFYIIWPKLYFYTVGMHTPVFMLFFVLFLAEFFQQKRQAHLYLGVGVALHFLLDAFQKHISDGYYWLFPFSWWTYAGGLFWPSQALTFIPLWCLFILISELILLRQQR